QEELHVIIPYLRILAKLLRKTPGVHDMRQADIVRRENKLEALFGIGNFFQPVIVEEFKKAYAGRDALPWIVQIKSAKLLSSARHELHQSPGPCPRFARGTETRLLINQ